MMKEETQILFCLALCISTVQTGSWDGYIDNLIAKSKDSSGIPQVDKACIIGLDDGEKWTTDGHDNALKLSVTEARKIARAFRSEDFSSFKNSGILAEGKKYQFLREEDGKVVLAKNKDFGALTLQTSRKAIVIGHTRKDGHQGNANKAIAAIIEYLEGLGM